MRLGSPPLPLRPALHAPARGQPQQQQQQQREQEMLLDFSAGARGQQRDSCVAGPLLALTSMAESKTPPPASSASSSPRSCSAATPHGIEHILSRPPPSVQQPPAQQPTNLQPAHRLAAAVSHACCVGHIDTTWSLAQ